MLTRIYDYGILLKRPTRSAARKRRASKVAGELAGGENWPPVFMIEAWPPPPARDQVWPPVCMDSGWPPVAPNDDWPGGSAWIIEAPVFEQERDGDPFGRRSGIDPDSPEGRWLASLDRNFPGWERWDGSVTRDLDRL